MSVTSIPSFGPEAEIYVLATNARENAPWEGTSGAADTDSLIAFVGEMIKKVGEAFSPPCDSSGLSKFQKGDPIPPHSHRA